ncbi:hypothetical protein L1987_56721 [Smallanthus sonchifolius]|uniref:Uncharacterized protein n=1 Tax=Smallanthus sonchifolius TaxID=185202 RepID=A0ACB9EDX3_9ASTR|nr:hypothetical protein L1987_56721 [Smallanthus sonchifolius]
MEDLATWLANYLEYSGCRSINKLRMWRWMSGKADVRLIDHVVFRIIHTGCNINMYDGLRGWHFKKDDRGNSRCLVSSASKRRKENPGRRHKSNTERTTSNPENEGNFNPVNIENSIFEMQVGGLREWEKLCLNPMHISWPKPWCLATSDPIHWEDIMSSVRQNRMMVPGDATGEPCRLRIQKSIEDVGAIQCNFFTDHDVVVDCLAKWLGSHNLNDHETRRKKAGNEKERSVWLDIDRDACQEEEAIHRQRMKKRKTKGKNPFTSVSHQQTNQGLGAEQGQDTGQKRKFIRVRSTKGRKQDNKWVCDKVHFSQELPAMMSISPLGFNEFRVGKDMVKDAGETQSTWKSRKNRMDILKKEIATKDARLEEIASNINATDTNSALRNSILKMKGSKLVKFSAKLNADGVACIDENMIEAEREPSMEQPSKNNGPHSSYAEMLSGIKQGGSEEKIQFYQPLGDGFILVNRRKGNNGFNGNGQHMHNRNVNNAGVFGHPKNRIQGHNYREIPPKPISTYERNIVKPKSQGMNPDKDGQQDDNKSSGGEVKTCGNSIGSSIGVQADGDTGNVQNEKQKPGRTAQVHVIETRNSFQLLDAEGNIMTDDAMGVNGVPQAWEMHVE